MEPVMGPLSKQNNTGICFPVPLAITHYEQNNKQNNKQNKNPVFEIHMQFIQSSVTALVTILTAIGAGVGIWGIVNLLEGYGNDNPGAKSQGIKQQNTVCLIWRC